MSNQQLAGSAAATRRQITCSLLLLSLLLPAAAAAACASCGASRFPTPGACVLDVDSAAAKATGSAACCADDEALDLLAALLKALGGDALAATVAAMDQGNSPFGAAILANKAPEYEVVYADANQVRA